MQARRDRARRGEGGARTGSGSPREAPLQNATDAIAAGRYVLSRFGADPDEQWEVEVLPRAKAEGVLAKMDA